MEAEDKRELWQTLEFLRAKAALNQAMMASIKRQVAEIAATTTGKKLQTILNEMNNMEMAELEAIAQREQNRQYINLAEDKNHK